MAVLVAASMNLGNLAAFSQTSVQRLLAYSTISQVGYLLVDGSAPARRQRTRRKKARSSSTNSCGCSAAAKWPPRAGSPQWRMSV